MKAKNVFIKIRSTPEEKSNWNKKASELGISLSELIRKSFGGVKTISNENKKIDPELIRQVAMIRLIRLSRLSPLIRLSRLNRLSRLSPLIRLNRLNRINPLILLTLLIYLIWLK